MTISFVLQKILDVMRSLLLIVDLSTCAKSILFRKSSLELMPLQLFPTFNLGNTQFGSGDVWILYTTLISLVLRAVGKMLRSDSQAEGRQA